MAAVGQAVKQNRQQSAHWRGKDSEHVRANRPMKGPTGFLRLTHPHLSQHMTYFMAAGWMNGGIPRMAMFRFMPGGGGTRGNGRGGRRPMLRVLESAMSSTL